MADPYADPSAPDPAAPPAPMPDATEAPDVDMEAGTDVTRVPPMPSIAAKLLKLIASQNLVPTLDDDVLKKISYRVINEYDIDKDSRKDWFERMEGAMNLAMLIAGEDKEYPFHKASNVKYPLLTVAALQFQARAYPAIVPGDRIVKCKVNGKDPQGVKAARADRVSEYTSWQLTEQMPEWEPDTDKLLVILPIVGCVFRKRYFDPALGRQVSRLVTADRMIVNYRARSLEEVPRTTEEMKLYPYEIDERILDGRFAKFEYGPAATVASPDGKTEEDQADDDAPHLFLEQHRLWDLDGDGYPEPYIITVHHASQTVCRIVANFSAETVRMTQDGKKVASIRKRDFYVKYGFLPSPDGGFYELGFGWLLKDNNEAINSNLNMMLDAGHLANIQGGIVSSALGMKEKTLKLKMGEWKVINTSADLRQSFMPIKYDGPSDVLFKLLGLLVEMGKEVASIKDVLSGETKQNMQPTTVLALIDQGMQFFTAIYKRIHRALKAELQIHGRLNEEHLSAEDYNSFFDDDQQTYDPKADFDDDMGITPASDPSTSSKMQKLARAEFLRDWAKENPLANLEEVNRRVLEAAEIEDIDKLMQQPPPPDPLMKMLGELEAQEKMAGITNLMTNAFKNIALGEAAEAGDQTARYGLILTALQKEIDTANGQQQQPADGGQGGLPDMAGQPSDAMGALPAPGAVASPPAGGAGVSVPSSPSPGPVAGPPA